MLGLTNLLLTLILSFTSLSAQSLQPIRLYGASDIANMSLEMKKQQNRRGANDIYELILINLTTQVKNKNHKKSLVNVLGPLKQDCATLAGNLEKTISIEHSGTAGMRKLYEETFRTLYPDCVELMINALSKNKTLIQYKNLIPRDLPVTKLIEIQSKPQVIALLKKLYPKNMVATYSFKALDSMDKLGGSINPTLNQESPPSEIKNYLILIAVILFALSLLIIFFIKIRG